MFLFLVNVIRRERTEGTKADISHEKQSSELVLRGGVWRRKKPEILQKYITVEMQRALWIDGGNQGIREKCEI